MLEYIIDNFNLTFYIKNTDNFPNSNPKYNTYINSDNFNIISFLLTFNYCKIY